MDLNVALTPNLLLNAVTAAHDTLVEQMSDALKRADCHSVDDLAGHFGLGLDNYAPSAVAFFINAGEATFIREGYTSKTKKKRTR